MTIHIYEDGQITGYYSGQACHARKDQSETRLEEIEPRKSHLPAPPVTTPKTNVGAEILSALFGLFLLSGCSSSAEECRSLEDLQGGGEPPVIPFNFNDSNDQTNSYAANLAGAALAQVPARFLSGVLRVEFVPELDRYARATTDRQRNETVITVRVREQDVVAAPEFSGPYWVQQLLHEVGHHVYKTICDDAGFGDISWPGPNGRTDYENFVSGYASNSLEEDFAESFSMYIYNPGKFRMLASRNQQVQAKYELLRTRFFHGQEFSQPWDLLDAAAVHLRSGELSEALLAYAQFNLEHNGNPEAGAALEERLDHDLWNHFLGSHEVALSPQEKIDELTCLIAAYSQSYPELTALFQTNLERYQP